MTFFFNENSLIKFKKLFGFTYPDSSTDINFTSISINMAEADIGSLTLQENTHRVNDGEDPVLLAQIVTERIDSYYIYRFDTMNDLVFKAIDAEEYHKHKNRSECRIYDVRCKSLKFLTVRYRGRKIVLAVN